MIFAAGLGVPFFSTDTCAAQRALEMGSDALLKGTKVDGVYTADPNLDPTPRGSTTIQYVDVLKEGYQVMDATAVSLCMENKLPDHRVRPPRGREHPARRERRAHRDARPLGSSATRSSR